MLLLLSLEIFLLSFLFHSFIFNLLFSLFFLDSILFSGGLLFKPLLLTGLFLGQPFSFLGFFAWFLLHFALSLFLLLLVEQCLLFLLFGQNPLSFFRYFLILFLLSLHFDLSSFILFDLLTNVLLHGLGLLPGYVLLAFLHEFDVAGVRSAHSREITDLLSLRNLVSKLL